MRDRIGREGGCVISVSDEGEFGLIARLTARFPPTGAIQLGPGDDAAVVEVADGRTVVSVDLMVEGRHFRRDWSSGYDVGRKAAAASLADIAAMGARPTAVLVGLAMPGELELSWPDALADGLRDECALVGAGVAGGDVTAGDRIVVAVTALGDLLGPRPVTRGGARPGDVVVVAGRLGYAAAGLALYQAGRPRDPLTAAHRRPEVDYDAAQRLARAGATAMIDVSDGLIADLGHLARSSGARIELRADRLPLDTPLRDAAAELGVDPLSWVAGGGDDHAFAATIDRDSAGDLPIIGEVVAGEPGVAFLDRTPPGPGGHEHFRPPESPD